MLRPPFVRLRRAPSATAAVLTALALAGCGDAPPPPVAPRLEIVPTAGIAGTQGRIAYMSVRDNNNQDIFVLDVAKGSARRLTRYKGYDNNPAWSPDGQRIAFETNRGTGRQIYVMSATGRAVTPVTNATDHGTANGDPTWSPDGTRLLYTSDVTSGPSGSDIYVIPADGSGPAVNLTNDPSAFNFHPAWAPNAGSTIKFAFTSNPVGGPNVFIFDESKTPALTQLTTGGGYLPAWSPDGTKIAYVDPNVGSRDIFVRNADGTGTPTNLTDNAAADEYPAWSSDGSKIAFVSSRDGNAELYVMNADGTNPRRLTVNTTLDRGPAWQP